MFKALIVDDEPAARRWMRSMLLQYADLLEISGEATNGAEAISMINEQKPDLVFLDIQMPDLTGFEVLKKISHQPNIIFTTAYEQYALKAFETFSIDYLLKPIREERLDQSLQKLKQFGFKHSFPDLEKLQKAVEEISGKNKPTAFPIKQGEKIILLSFESISHFEGNDKYVFLFSTDGKKYLTDDTLTSLEARLPQNFIRVQKSYIINKEKVGELHKHFNGRYILVMQDKTHTRIQTGLTFREKVKEAFVL